MSDDLTFEELSALERLLTRAADTPTAGRMTQGQRTAWVRALRFVRVEVQRRAQFPANKVAGLFIDDDGERYDLMQVFGQDGLRLAYELAVGWLSPTMVRVMVAAKAAEYDVGIRVEFEGEGDPR